MEIKKTKCAEETPYLTIEGGCYEVEFMREDEEWFNIEITNNNTGGGELLQISKRELKTLIILLQTEIDKMS